MADYRSMFSSAFLNARDLAGEERVCVIEKVVPGVVGDEEKDQPVITFEGEKKLFGCNRTNGDTIANLYGKETDEWVGKAVTLYPSTTPLRGAIVDCIRIRPEVPGGQRGRKSASSEAKRIRELEAELAKARGKKPAAKKGTRR